MDNSTLDKIEEHSPFSRPLDNLARILPKGDPATPVEDSPSSTRRCSNLPGVCYSFPTSFSHLNYF
ncbi:hypothetical protein E2C01_074472 [Portunus trituberculatus]|uniref:Uncharacterized protein n=1 Tax=Portunus trituberculatus TaxID=210409 RepID=A0A5B7ICG5_PORTR|nr:hypothetical protein [Portunus trituberculatus]